MSHTCFSLYGASQHKFLFHTLEEELEYFEVTWEEEL